MISAPCLPPNNCVLLGGCCCKGRQASQHRRVHTCAVIKFKHNNQNSCRGTDAMNALGMLCSNSVSLDNVPSTRVWFSKRGSIGLTRSMSRSAYTPPYVYRYLGEYMRALLLRLCTTATAYSHHIHVAYSVHLHDFDRQPVIGGTKPPKLAADKLVIVQIGPQAICPLGFESQPTFSPCGVCFWDVVVNPRLVYQTRDLV